MTLVRRVALALLVASGVVVGVWAQFAPRSFYDDFPGFGRTWVAIDGPFNEHLIRDVGGLNLALALVAGWALVTSSVVIARAAGAAALVYGLPHLVYHSAHLGGLETVDAVGNVVSLSLAVVIAAVAALAPAAVSAPSDH